MQRVLLLEVEELGGERRWARLEAAATCPLPRLNAWMSELFGLGPELRYGFRLAGRGEHEDSTFFGPGRDHLLAAERTQLGDLAPVAGRRLLHSCIVTPLRERVVRVLEVREGAPTAEPLRELERGARGRPAGAGPDPDEVLWRIIRQLESLDEELEEQAWADDVEERRQLAHDLAALVAADPSALGALQRLGGGLAFEWLENLHIDLLELGREPEAFAVLAAMACVLGPEEVRSYRQLLLVEVGRTDEALADADRWLAEAPQAPWARVYVARLQQLVGDPARSEEHYRRALALAGDDLAARAAALEGLADLLMQAGRTEEAIACAQLHDQAASELEDEEWNEDPDGDEEPRPARAAPRVGRNDPCPCGSGRKYKRCCAIAQEEAASSDSALLERLLEELEAAGDDPAFQRRLQDQMERFAGAEHAGRSAAQVLPVLPSDELADALVDWGLLDLDLGEGRSLVDVVEHARRKTLTRRERSLLEQLRSSQPSAWQVRAVRPGDEGPRARLVDLLDAAAPPVEVPVGPGVTEGYLFLARLLELDGVLCPAPGSVPLPPQLAAVLAPRLRQRFSELRSADPDSPWPVFRKRHSAELYREAIAVLQEQLEKL